MGMGGRSGRGCNGGGGGGWGGSWMPLSGAFPLPSSVSISVNQETQIGLSLRFL